MALHIVTGPPASGKSTYVRKRAATGDVIVDFDELAHALGSPTRHRAQQPFRDLTFVARQAVIRRVLTAPHDDTWIIHTNPTDEQLADYRRHNASIHTVDPGINVVRSQARRDNRPDGTQDAITTWYRDHQGRPTAAQALRAFGTGR